MNILVWNSWVTPAGGMERVALSIANGLATRPGNKVVLTGPYQTVPVLHQRIGANVEFAPCAFARRPDTMLQNWWHLRRLVRKHAIDVVSAHGSLIPLIPLDVPVVWTEHGPRYGDQPILQGSRAVTWRAIQRRLKAGDWKLVGCSQYVRDRVCSQLDIPFERAAVILNGIPNPDHLRLVPPPTFDKPFKLGFLGRMEPEKYPFDIFALEQYLRLRGVPHEWHVFGEGSLAEEMRARAASLPQIKVHGLAANAAEAFAQMDAMVFLSHGQMEGLPTVILEARQARRPVIAWDVTANPEAAGPHDELVAPFDLDAFGAAIQRVLTRAAVPAPVGEIFSFDKMVDRYNDVLRQHVADCSRPMARAVGGTA